MAVRIIMLFGKNEGRIGHDGDPGSALGRSLGNPGIEW